MKAYNDIVLNIPHSSPFLPCDSGWGNLLELQKEIRIWTDWHTNILFSPNKELTDKVKAYLFPYSRFYIDAERLVNDPLDEIGQGIIYEEYNGLHREMGKYDRVRLMRLYHRYIRNISSAIGNNTLVIDCHSFPSHLSDVDICLGFNEDESKPDEEDILHIKKLFSSHGYNVGINDPYSNSITPKRDIVYNSLMIEVNKSCYMDENTLALKPDYYKVGNLIQTIYEYFLGLD